jgi:LuxR family transcriptional regulator, maltose regulon positive regulatory protein
VLTQVAVEQVQLWLIQGKREEATPWAQTRKQRKQSLPRYIREQEDLAEARLLLAEERPGEAMELLDRLLPEAKVAGQGNHVNKILVLQALVHQARDDSQQALAVLEHAVSLAEPAGYVRVFLDEERPMEPLLTRLLSSTAFPEYVRTLLIAFEHSTPAAPPASSEERESKVPQLLAEPLSERELEVLRLMAGGVSNREIAQELVIAVNTVKRHTSNILAKLGASNRTQAVAQARELGLL